jgi:CheY-like chemotaxis protein
MAKVLSVVETLLLVDGETTHRNALKFILELNGYRVVEATHGIEGWQILDGFGDRIHLALCAADLPDMTGPEWLSHVRIITPDLPGLLLGENERTDVGRMIVGPWYGGMPARPPAPRAVDGPGLLEKIRGALDETFFARFEKIPA